MMNNKNAKQGTIEEIKAYIDNYVEHKVADACIEKNVEIFNMRSNMRKEILMRNKIINKMTSNMLEIKKDLEQYKVAMEINTAFSDEYRKAFCDGLEFAISTINNNYDPEKVVEYFSNEDK